MSKRNFKQKLKLKNKLKVRNKVKPRKLFSLWLVILVILLLSLILGFLFFRDIVKESIVRAWVKTKFSQPQVPISIITVDEKMFQVLRQDPSEKELIAIWGKHTPGQKITNMIFPVNGEVLTRFGQKRIVRTISGKEALYIHEGVDISAPRNAPVLACATGNVVLVKDLPRYGKTIVLDHGRGIYSQYSHLANVFVRFGQTVKAGQLIGGVGSTGLSTGNHLHWQIMLEGVAVDPLEIYYFINIQKLKL